MSVNKFLPYVYILPEDDADRQIANGFVLDSLVNLRAVQVLPPPGGWRKVRDEFEQIHCGLMSGNPNQHIVLLVDFDDQTVDRMKQMRAFIPKSLADRVFVIGVESEPERLKVAIGTSYEQIGQDLARECRGTTRDKWSHFLLKHNSAELDRMTPILKPILFPTS